VREWFPPECGESLPVDCRYFGSVFAEMDRHLSEVMKSPLHVYLTYDHNSLPEYGNHVVALLLGEEFGLVPRYARHVRAVLKTHRSQPVLGSRTWWKVDHLHLILWLKFLRNCAQHVRSRFKATFVPRNWPLPIHKRAKVFDVPVGYGRQERLDQKTMGERPFHCFFAGGVNLAAPFWRKLIPSPKVIARKKMFAVIQEMVRTNPHFRFDGGEVSQSCSPSGSADPRSYSQRLMDSKICLAPRGTAPDTYRFFEGLRAGCLVICEHLPGDWFYDGAPVVRIDDWAELPDVIRYYLADEVALEKAGKESQIWWTEKCSERAVGRAVAALLMEQEPVRSNKKSERISINAAYADPGRQFIAK